MFSLTTLITDSLLRRATCSTTATAPKGAASSARSRTKQSESCLTLSRSVWVLTVRPSRIFGECVERAKAGELTDGSDLKCSYALKWYAGL